MEFRHALEGVSGVASFITTDEQLQLNRGSCLLVQALLPGGFPFHQFNYTPHYVAKGLLIISFDSIANEMYIVASQIFFYTIASRHILAIIDALWRILA